MNITKKVSTPSQTPISAKPIIQRSLSPHSSMAATSRPASDDGWDVSGTTTHQSPKVPAAPSMAGMSKEEKAAELARRREERKQACLSFIVVTGTNCALYSE